MSYHSFFRKGAEPVGGGKRLRAARADRLAELCSAGCSSFEMVRHLHFLSLSLLALGQALVLAKPPSAKQRSTAEARVAGGGRMSWRVVPRAAPARGGCAGALPEPPACSAAARGAAGQLGCTGDGGVRHL